MTDRETVTITVPDEWAEEADEADIYRSEFFRRLIRAGRRQWGYDHIEEADHPHLLTSEPSPGASELQEVLPELILANLDHQEGMDEEDILEAIVADLDKPLNEALEELNGEDDIEYKPLAGGWVLG